MAIKIACLILALTVISLSYGFQQSSPEQDNSAPSYPKNEPGDFVDDSAFSNGHGQGGVEPQGRQLPGNGLEYLMGAPAPHKHDSPVPNRPTNEPGDFVDDSAFSNGHGQGGVAPQGPQLPGNGLEYLMGAPAPHKHDSPVPNRPTNEPGDFVDDSAFSNGHGQGGVAPQGPQLPGNGLEYLMGAPAPHKHDSPVPNRPTNEPGDFVDDSAFSNGHGQGGVEPQGRQLPGNGFEYLMGAPAPHKHDSPVPNRPTNEPGDFVDDSAFSNGHGQGDVEPQGRQLPGNGLEYLMGAPAPHKHDSPVPNRPTNEPGDFVDDSAFSNGHGQGGVAPQGPQLPGNGFEYLMGAPLPHNHDSPVPKHPINEPMDFRDDSAFSNGHGEVGVEPMKPLLPGSGFEYLMGAPVPHDYENPMSNVNMKGPVMNEPDDFILYSIFNNGHGPENVKPMSIFRGRFRPGSQTGFGPGNDHGFAYGLDSQGHFGQGDFGGHENEIYSPGFSYGPFGKGGHGQDYFGPGIHGQNNFKPGSQGQEHFGPIHSQDHFGPGNHGQGYFGPGSHDQGHFRPGSHNQGHFRPGSHEQGHFGPVSRDQGHFRPSHDQGHFRPGSHDQGHFRPGSHDQGHFGPGVYDQGNFGPGNHGHDHFRTGNHDHDHLRPGSHVQDHFGPRVF